MDRNTPTNPPASASERRLARLVVPAPSAYEPQHRIDWIHAPCRQPTPADASEPDEAAEAADGAHGPRHPDP